MDVAKGTPGTCSPHQLMHGTTKEKKNAASLGFIYTACDHGCERMGEGAEIIS